MYKKWNVRRVSLWIVFVMQIVLVVLYFATQNDTSSTLVPPNLNSNAISFISAPAKNVTKARPTFYTERNRVILPTRQVAELYEDFNTSLCYRHGTDLKQMRRSKDVNWRCACLPGWHGTDCGQPEVIWRAILTSRGVRAPGGPRRLQRRLVHFIEVRAPHLDFTEIALYELKDVVDLFVLFEAGSDVSATSKLGRGLLRDMYSKILYVTGANKNEAWLKCKKIIKNLREDDIFFINNDFEIPNARALQFLKLYNEWPEPVTLRLRWSVYGFFWKHPLKTALSTGACTVHYLSDALADDLDVLTHKSVSDNTVKDKQGLIVGDLNHFGGWLCELCLEPAGIIQLLRARPGGALVLERLHVSAIDAAYVEELIENGVYVDGKTELERARKSHENYYAPDYVANNSWKYDWLLTNLYSKIDYY